MNEIRANAIFNFQDLKIAALLNGCRKNDRRSQKEMYFLLFAFASKICCSYTGLDREPIDIINDGFLIFFKTINEFNEDNRQKILLALRIWFKKILIEACAEYCYKPSFTIQKQEVI